MQLDLSDLESVKTFAERVKEKFEKVDILVNNAGVIVSPDREVTSQNLEKHFGVNHIGTYLLTTLLLDKIKASDQGRIITVASLTHNSVKPLGKINFDDLQFERCNYSWYSVYAHSKLCNVYFSM